MRRRKIGGGEHRDHAFRLLRIGRIDAGYLREGMRRAHKKGRKCALGFDVVTEVALPAQERIVFDASRPGAIAGSGRLRHAVLR